jgi:lipoprotein-releasing system permease protein
MGRAFARPSRHDGDAMTAKPLRSWVPFEWIVAIRFLREGRVQSAFIIGGVALGVAVIVFMSALMAGVQENMIGRTLTGQAHIQLSQPREEVRLLRNGEPGLREGAIVQAPLQRLKSIDQWQGLVAQVRATPGVAAVSPVVSGSAVVVRGDATRVVLLTGMESALHYRIVPLPDKIVHGTARATVTDIVIGTELATDLGVGVGDKLRVQGAGGVTMTLTITGIFDLGNKGANARSTFLALRTAQALMDLPGGVTQIDLTVHDVYDAERIARRIAGAAPVQADSWISSNAQFFSAVSAQSMSNTSIRFFVGLSVAFGIASVLVVSVVQKSREIGILRAMGIQRGQVMRVFLLQGGLLGLAGAVVGSALGTLALVTWQKTVLSADGTPMFALVLPPALYGWTFALATVTGLLAAVAPARRAARLDPVVAING